VRQYPCCVGPGDKTVPGTYTIEERMVKPVWRDPKTGKQYQYGQPEYALGTRWLGFNEDRVQGLGIHGTNKPESIPGRTSNGCVRLHEQNVEELFAFALLGTQVVVVE
ncbi:MAG: L,D-transpeptidase, partial [Planctomycetes bacterium]|nr:L,D-transpeptidase [Planctomycetota bacterium]